MTEQEFNQYCGSFKETSHVVQWGGADVWKVAGKVFAVAWWNKNDKAAFTFKTSEQNFYFLSEHPGYIPAPYFANRGMKWIQQIQTDGSLDEELRYYVAESYQLVVLGFSKKKQRDLGLELST